MQILEPDIEFDNPRASSASSLACVAPFLIIDGFSRKSFSYNKLPQKPINLTVIKLDGSSFDIEVANTATVAELKQAVEAAFSHLPKKGCGRVSWPHVWGQFCLCYLGSKLLCDIDTIAMYGIQEGDKLHFVRHTSVFYNLVKTRSEKEDIDSEQPTISSYIRDSYQESEKKDRNDYCSELVIYKAKENKTRDVHGTDQEKLAGIVRGWFSYRRLANSELSNVENSSSRSSKLKHGFFRSFKNLVRAYSTKDISRI